MPFFIFCKGQNLYSPANWATKASCNDGFLPAVFKLAIVTQLSIRVILRVKKFDQKILVIQIGGFLGLEFIFASILYL